MPFYFSMTFLYVSGDPLLTRAQFLAFGHNARGRTELGNLETELLNRYPAPFSVFRRQCKTGRVETGTFWLWHESTPSLAFLVIRESSVGATRLRYVQSALLALARDYSLESIHSIAIAPLGHLQEWPEILRLLESWLNPLPIPIIVYQTYLPGIQAAENMK
jgi:hypothetical protein